MKLFRSFFFLFFISSAFSAQKSEFIEAELVEETPIESQRKKLKLYPKNLPEFFYLQECKKNAYQKPCRLQTLQREEWVDTDPKALTIPLQDTHTSALRCVHQSKNDDLSVKSISTMVFTPNWSTRTFERTKTEKTTIHGPLSKLPLELRNIYKAIPQALKSEPGNKTWHITRSVERTYAPSQIKFAANKEKFWCSLIEQVQARGTLRKAQDVLQTIQTPLLQEFAEEKRSAESYEKDAIELQERINTLTEPPAFSKQKKKGLLKGKGCVIL